ncbi:hypothetical protein BC832DRAFT_538908 [Gaertneriomyces semiglobifer]|nr:hypothetical protein BC832DRAFT_538908 [Gaertneriomyces semiglobifer]
MTIANACTVLAFHRSELASDRCTCLYPTSRLESASWRLVHAPLRQWINRLLMLRFLNPQWPPTGAEKESTQFFSKPPYHFQQSSLAEKNFSTEQGFSAPIGPAFVVSFQCSRKTLATRTEKKLRKEKSALNLAQPSDVPHVPKAAKAMAALNQKTVQTASTPSCTMANNLPRVKPKLTRDIAKKKAARSQAVTPVKMAKPNSLLWRTTKVP